MAAGGVSGGDIAAVVTMGIVIGTFALGLLRQRQDSERDYVRRLEDDNRRCDEERERWRQRAETAESNYNRLLQDFWRNRRTDGPIKEEDHRP